MKYKQYPVRDAIKNYFPTPNEIFSLGLKPGALCVYSYLMYLEDRESHLCWPSYKTIGKAVGMSENTVRKYVMLLEERRFITTQPTFLPTDDGEVRNGNLRYTIRPIQEAIDCFNARQMARLEAAVERRRVAKKLAKRARAAPYAPPCAASENALSPSPTEDGLDGSGAVSEGFRGAKEQAGERAGAFAAPARSLLPAVRAVEGVLD